MDIIKPTQTYSNKLQWKNVSSWLFCLHMTDIMHMFDSVTKLTDGNLVMNFNLNALLA